MLIRSTILLLIVALLQLGLSSMAQPTIKTSWEQINELSGSFYLSGKTEPRVATFSDGRYVVVYTVQTAGSYYNAVGKIYNGDGTVYKAEFALADNVASGDIHQAPNVVIFEDDSFLAVWRYVNSDPDQIKARRFNPDGTAAGASFNAYDSNISPSSGNSIEVVATRLNGFAMVYSAASSCTGAAVVQFDANNNQIFSQCYDSGTLSDPKASLVYDSYSTNVFFSHETDSGGLLVGGVGSDALNRYSQRFAFSTVDPMTLSEPSILVNAQDSMSVFSVASNSIYAFSVIPPLPAPGSVRQNLFKQSTTSIFYSSPRTVRISDESTLVAYRLTNINTNTKYIGYQLASYTPSSGQIIVAPLGNEVTAQSNIVGLYMTVLPRSSDIVMVGKDTSTLAVMRQVLTFCGNGVLDMEEECDGSANCDTNCRCLAGFYGFNGVCTYPNVEPSLDCVEVRQTGYVVYFSFNNRDAVDHNIDYGLVNYFAPENLATDRPTLYPSGQSLIYPASPYSTAVPFSISTITWQLGSYNLTVDVTDPALMCSNSTSFAINVASKTSTSNAATIVQNFANKYGVDISRLSYAEYTITDTVPYRFLIRITISSATTQGQPATKDVLGSLFSDYKNTTKRAQIESDLVTGAPGTVIKEVTPVPGGTEVRGTRSDPNTNPRTPSGTFTPISNPSNGPSSTNPGSPSSSNPNNPNSPGTSRGPDSALTSSASLSQILLAKLLLLIFGFLLV